MGGIDNSATLGNVERLDPREGNNIINDTTTKGLLLHIKSRVGINITNTFIGKWQSVPALSQRRSSTGLASLDGNLYCVGGSDGR